MQPRARRHGSRAAGMTVVEAMVAVALLGLLAILATAMRKHHVDGVTSIAARGKDADLRDFVRNSISCSHTFRKKAVRDACQQPGGSTLVLRDEAGKVLVANGAEPTVLFGSKVTARCEDLGGFFGVAVAYLPLSKTGDPRQDALTKATSTWKDLFFDVPFACATECDLHSTFATSPDPAWTQPDWLAPGSSCPYFTTIGGKAVTACADNRGRMLRPAAPECVPQASSDRLHIEAKVTTSAWADGYPNVGIWLGSVWNEGLWFTLLSDTIAGPQSQPITLRPLVAEGWVGYGGALLQRSPMTAQPGVQYHLTVDIAPGSQVFTVRNAAGTVLSSLATTSAFDVTDQPVNFFCGEATCDFRDLVVQIDPSL